MANEFPSPAAILRKAKASALLVTDLSNIRYLSGMAMSGGYILIVPRRILLYANDLYIESARLSAVCSVRPAEKFTADLRALRVCGFEAGNVTVAQLKLWTRMFPNMRFKPTEGVIEEFRRTKSPQELAAIRAACAITRRILEKIPDMLETGIQESRLAWEIEGLAIRMGAQSMAFETIVAFGEHTSSPHHRPTDAAFKPGDLVQIDMGVRVRGYCSDFSRVYFTGKPNAEQKKAYRALSRAKNSCVKAVKAGASSRALDTLARSILAEDGYGPEFNHSLGHGVGLDIHEGLRISAKAPDKKLLANEVVTIEPGLYFPGKWGMRVEDTIIVS